jgi:EmrB/QacA subfamily drug resistance transporter
MLTTTHSASTSSGWLGRLQASRWAALPVLMAGTFMIVLDFFIVNVALPSMQSRLHAGPSVVEWVVAGYGLTFSTFLIAAGRLGDRIGRRRMLSIGLALFALASAGCGLAPTASVLIAFRLLQGLGAALVGPTVLSIIGVTYSGPDRVRAISVYGTVMGVAAASGQLIGGALVQANPAGLGWRTVFLINLPIAAAALALSGRLVPESRSAGAGRLDLPGTALVTVGLTAIVLPLVQGRQYGWPAWTIASLAAAPVVLGIFVWHQISLRQRGGAPLVDMSLFKDRSFAAGLVSQLGLWCGQASFFLVLALYLQEGRGLSALSSGLVFTILAGAYLMASIPAPALTGRFGRSLVGFGALSLAAGHGLLLAAVWHEGTGGSILTLVPGLVLVGAGMGLYITPLATVLLSSSSPERAGAVSGIMSTVQQIGNSLGVAVTGVIFFGAVHQGVGHAFELTLVELGLLLLAVAALSRLLPARAGRDGGKSEAQSRRAGPGAPRVGTAGASAAAAPLISDGDILGALQDLVGSGVTGARLSDRGTVVMTGGDWALAMADVASVSGIKLIDVVAGPARVTGAGRYGRFWWMAVEGTGDNEKERAVVMGSRIRLMPAGTAGRATPEDLGLTLAASTPGSSWGSRS